MENKIIEFVKEFNTELEKSIEYNLLQYQNDGFNQGIILPRLILFSDSDRSGDHYKTVALSSLVKQLSELQEIAAPMLADEIDKFFAEKRTQIKEKFTYAKISYARIATCRWKISVSGAYNEDIMEQFMKVLQEDFDYMFDGLTLDVEY